MMIDQARSTEVPHRLTNNRIDSSLYGFFMAKVGDKKCLEELAKKNATNIETKKEIII